MLPLKSEENERIANIKGLEHAGTGVWVKVPTGDAGSTGQRLSGGTVLPVALAFQ